MIRRTYKIMDETDAHIGQLAKKTGLDKEQIVQMALDAGLIEVEKFLVRMGESSSMDILRKQLLSGKDGSITSPRAKRR